MTARFRPPLFVLPVALLALIGLLATLQYRWLGQISEAERDRMRATLGRGASQFAQDFDREIARAYLLFQAEPAHDESDFASRFAARYDRWHATSRFPKLLKDYYVFTPNPAPGTLRRFDPSTRTLVSAEWPSTMSDWRTRLADDEQQTSGAKGTMFIRRMPPAIWESAPAIVVPVPLLVLSERPLPDFRVAHQVSYTILALDRDYISGELLPSLAAHHFNQRAPGEFQIAVVSQDPSAAVVYRSTPAFTPKPEAPADATVEFFQVRPQDFSTIAAEVRRFTAFATAIHTDRGGKENIQGRITFSGQRPLSILVRPGGSAPPDDSGPAAARIAALSSPRWRLVLKHSSGSLEAAVNAARRRNLMVSFGVLAVLSASIGLLVLSTRRAQRLARQQMEFVAAVSHELRTPLAVIRSAAENLADGVVHDETRIRTYGELVRGEGRRLTEMVEQILEFAGIHSGQRSLQLAPVAVAPLLEDAAAAVTSIADGRPFKVDVNVPLDLPPVLGDEPALGRVLQNLVANAVKYGEPGRWVGLRASRHGSDVRITVADRGMGIEPAEQGRIFEPFYRAPAAVAAQIQGAGLGLSLVQRIIEAHGGRVTVASTPGHGAEFTLHLPVATEARVRGVTDPGNGISSPVADASHGAAR